MANKVVTGTGVETLTFCKETFVESMDFRDHKRLDFDGCTFDGRFIDPTQPGNLLVSQRTDILTLRRCVFRDFPFDALRVQYSHGLVIIEDCEFIRPYNDLYSGIHPDGIQIAPDTTQGPGYIGALFMSGIRMDYTDALWRSQSGWENAPWCGTMNLGDDNRIPQNIHIKTINTAAPAIGYLDMSDIAMTAWTKAGINIEGVAECRLDLDSIHMLKLGGTGFIDPAVTVRRTNLNPGGLTDSTPLDLKIASNVTPLNAFSCP